MVNLLKPNIVIGLERFENFTTSIIKLKICKQKKKKKAVMLPMLSRSDINLKITGSMRMQLKQKSEYVYTKQGF